MEKSSLFEPILRERNASPANSKLTLEFKLLIPPEEQGFAGNTALAQEIQEMCSLATNA